MSEVPPPPDSISELVQDRARRRRRLLLVLFVAIPLVVGGGVFAWWKLGEQAAERAVQHAWSELSGCLVGPPLAAGERASVRFRNVQLAAPMAEPAGIKDEDRWPMRCADTAAKLDQALREHRRGSAPHDRLREKAEKIALELRKGAVMTDWTALVDELYEVAAAAGAVAEPVDPDPAPPAPLEPLTMDNLPAAARLASEQFTLKAVYTDEQEHSQQLHVLVDDRLAKNAPFLCRFSAQGKARCRKLGEKIAAKSGLRLHGTTALGAWPLVFAGRWGTDGIFRSDTGELVAAKMVHSASVGADGYVAIATYGLDGEDDGRFELIEQPKPGAKTKATVVGPEAVAGKDTKIHRRAVLWNHLIVQVINDDEEDYDPRMYHKRLPTKLDGDYTKVGPLDWVNADFRGCASPEAVVVRIGDRSGFLSFITQSGWSKLVPVESFWGTFGCDGAQATFTDGSGSQMRCDTAGCQPMTQQPRLIFLPFAIGEQRLATVLGGRALAIATTTARGGVRMRFGTPEQLAAKGEVPLLYDDLVRKGEVQHTSSWLDMRLFRRDQFAILLVSTPNGVYALRFGADGQYEPVEISW